MTSSGWPRAVVFDLDGTLVDSAADLRAALNHVLEGEGLRPHSLAEVRAMVGGGVPVLLGRAYRAQGRTLAGSDAAPLVRRFLAYYTPRATEFTTLYPGAAALIDALAGQGVRLGICTNKPHDITETVLRDLGVLDRFDAVVGTAEGRPRKPDPAMLLETLRGLGTAPAEAAMIGDSEVDVATARAGGLPVVLVAYGYSARPAAELGADAVIDALAEAPAAIARLAGRRAVPQS